MDITQTNVMDGGPACQAGCIARERLQGIRDATSFCHQIYGRDWMRRTFSKLKSLCAISNGSYGRGASPSNQAQSADARDECKNVIFPARPEFLFLGWEEAEIRAKQLKRIVVDAAFVEALRDRDAVLECLQELYMPVFANVIEGSDIETISAEDQGEVPWVYFCLCLPLDDIFAML
ncbi:hypothetical protein HBH70_230080 [Parastagonospora nodorum]|nr:hypothetical protein HBH52_215720 [Parastagonospora nodorum]KAH4010565.1 hypothetical protein HBI09_230290 [Parastagonospora nodorum]KAH4080502.1 hypothetical protein HBH46_228930 [Parastagonospora nodorum]KAH4152090.1 hypothetical protein HBH43_236170 [Parastagonospora nodorum]KAH4193768.1 hypothetical protein HBH42_105130 [Parastagonospora nodorum]